MVKIENYMQEKDKRAQKQTDYRQKLRRHKLTAVYRVLLVLIAVIALILLIVVQYRRHVYTDYDMISSVEQESLAGTRTLRLGDSVLTYSRDGAHCTNSRGEVTWNQTYGIQDVKLSACGNTVAIGEYNGRNIYVANSEKLLGNITTTMPIRDLAVASTGAVVAVLADTDITWINTYDSSGKLCYEGRTYMNNSGYPASISLSPNGELLCVAYVYVDTGVIKTNIAFYNLGTVGDNYGDHLVGGYPYTDMLVPYVRFMNNETAFAVGDGRLMIYSGGYKPENKGEFLYDEEVKSVFYSDRYIGLVFDSDDRDHLYKLNVYSAAAERVGSYYFDMAYTDIFFGKDNVVIYNESKCRIITLDGIEKFNGSFAKSVELMLPLGSSYQYMLITGTSIDKIQLK